MDRRNASKIIHVERIVGFTKTFKILNTTLNSEETNMDGKIMCVLHADGFQVNENMYTALSLVFISIQMMKHTSTAIIKWLNKDTSYFKTNLFKCHKMTNFMK